MGPRPRGAPALPRCLRAACWVVAVGGAFRVTQTRWARLTVARSPPHRLRQCPGLEASRRLLLRRPLQCSCDRTHRSPPLLHSCKRFAWNGLLLSGLGYGQFSRGPSWLFDAAFLLTRVLWANSFYFWYLYMSLKCYSIGSHISLFIDFISDILAKENGGQFNTVDGRAGTKVEEDHWKHSTTPSKHPSTMASARNALVSHGSGSDLACRGRAWGGFHGKGVHGCCEWVESWRLYGWSNWGIMIQLDYYYIMSCPLIGALHIGSHLHGGGGTLASDAQSGPLLFRFYCFVNSVIDLICVSIQCIILFWPVNTGVTLKRWRTFEWPPQMTSFCSSFGWSRWVTWNIVFCFLSRWKYNIVIDFDIL